MADFRQYKVWQRAHDLTQAVYDATKTFPAEERYSLKAQIRRSTMSVPTNLAEGFGRRTDRERARFLDIAIGSAYECEYQLLLSKDLGYLPDDKYNDLQKMLVAVRKMLFALSSKLRH